MALEKSYTNVNGVSGNWWVVGNALYDNYRKASEFSLLLYASSTHRANGFQPLLHFVFSQSGNNSWFVPANVNAEGMNNVKKAYQYVKTLVDPSNFDTAIDFTTAVDHDP